MMRLRDKATCWGVDISSSAIKVLALARKKQRYIVKAYANIALADDAVVDGRIEQPAVVAATLRQAVKLGACSARNAVIAVPSKAAITKTIALPAGLSGRELEESVLQEAENHIPYPLSEIRLDFAVLTSTASVDDAMQILLAASRSEHVDSRLSVLESAGLKAQRVDIESYSIEHLLPRLLNHLNVGERPTTVALADIGAKTTSLYVLVNGALVFSREQEFGGHLLSEKMAQYYGLSYAQAEQQKQRGCLAADYETAVLAPFKMALAATISRALQFFFSSSNQYPAIDHLLLTGGSSVLPGMPSLLSQQTSIPVSLVDPLVDMAVATTVDRQALKQDTPTLLLACALATRGLL